MFDPVFHMFDSVATFVSNISFTRVVDIYWFLIFVEFPRYYLLEIIIVTYRKLTFSRRKKQKDLARYKLYRDYPLVSILVPGKNEGPNIYKLVCSLREQTYQNFELIVVDDGSDDWTPQIGADLSRAGMIQRFLRLNERGGKASAANYGLYHAQGKYVIHLDADSSLDRDAIENILIPFYTHERTMGVGGCVKVRNGRTNLCTSIQALEYLKTIMVGRIVSSQLGIYRTISGAFGAFDTARLRQVGGWDIGPGLDGDITQKLRKAGGRIDFTEDAVCLTNVPTSFYRLMKQRYRWSRSLVRFRLRKHRDVFIPNRNFRILNFLSSVENILFDSVFNFVWLFYILNLIFSANGVLFEVFFLGYVIRLSFAMVAFAVILWVSERRREELYLFKYLPLSTFYTGYYLRLIRLVAHVSEFFFRTSYHDSWNPRKTSIYAQMQNE